MGWGGYTFCLGLLLDEHGGQLEQAHERRAQELARELRELAEKYQDIVVDVQTEET